MTWVAIGLALSLGLAAPAPHLPDQGDRGVSSATASKLIAVYAWSGISRGFALQPSLRRLRKLIHLSRSKS